MGIGAKGVNVSLFALADIKSNNNQIQTRTDHAMSSIVPESVALQAVQGCPSLSVSATDHSDQHTREHKDKRVAMIRQNVPEGVHRSFHIRADARLAPGGKYKPHRHQCKHSCASNTGPQGVHGDSGRVRHAVNKRNRKGKTMLIGGPLQPASGAKANGKHVSTVAITSDFWQQVGGNLRQIAATGGP